MQVAVASQVWAVSVSSVSHLQWPSGSAGWSLLSPLLLSHISSAPPVTSLLSPLSSLRSGWRGEGGWQVRHPGVRETHGLCWEQSWESTKTVPTMLPPKSVGSQMSEIVPR